MYPFPTLSHDQLINLAHDVLDAAQDHDPHRIDTDALRLFQGLIDHVLAERPAFLHLAPADARLLLHGQEHIIDLLFELTDSAAENAADCHCEHIAGSVVTELVNQASDEHRHLLAGID